MFTAVSETQLFLPFLSMRFRAAGCDGHRRAPEGEYLSVQNGFQPFPSSVTKPGPLSRECLLSSSGLCACNLVAKFVVLIHDTNNLISGHGSFCTFSKANARHVSGQKKKEVKANGSLTQAQCWGPDFDLTD